MARSNNRHSQTDARAPTAAPMSSAPMMIGSSTRARLSESLISSPASWLPTTAPSKAPAIRMMIVMMPPDDDHVRIYYNLFSLQTPTAHGMFSGDSLTVFSRRAYNQSR
jgi:hypothetical protein